MGYRINRSEREQQLLNMLFSYLGEHYDSSELYEILHHDLGMTHSDIELLGFDLKDCYCMESNEINMGRLNLNAETDLSRLMERPMLLSTVHLSLIDRTSGEVEEALYDHGARYAEDLRNMMEHFSTDEYPSNNLMNYFVLPTHPKIEKRIREKVLSATPGIYVDGETIYAALNLQMTEDLTQRELELFEQQIADQYENGWGGALELQDIDTACGDLICIRLWHDALEFYPACNLPTETEATQEITM